MAKSEYPTLKYESRQGKRYIRASRVLTDRLLPGFEKTFSTFEEALECKQLGRENILGIGCGYKVVEGKPLRKWAIHLAVVRKAPPEEVQVEYLADSLVKKHLGLKYRTDVFQVGFPEPHRRQSLNLR